MTTNTAYRRTLSPILALPLLMSYAACGSDERPPSYEPDADDGGSANLTGSATTGSGGGQGSVDGTNGGSGGAGPASGANSTGGAAGAAGEASSSGGSGGSGGGSAVCGDGSVGDDEDCEPGMALGRTCADVGFEVGQLACRSDCQFDISDCSGTERCFDTLDNDGDEAADCADSDCAATCQNSCAEPPDLMSGDTVEGSTLGRASQIAASCSSESGSEMIYQVTADLTGRLEVEVEARAALTVSLRASCADDESELACRVVQGVTRASADISQGEVVFVVVEGFEAQVESDFSLSVESRLVNQCGDGFVDALEQCDDENLLSGDGCDAMCNVESNENEPNDTAAEGSEFSHPQYATIDPAGDVDYYSLQVDDGPRLVTINTFNLGVGYCSQLLMDPQLELFSSADALLASDDDGGDGYCAKIVTTLESGAYYIVVRESDDPGEEALSTFPYRLGVTIQ